MPLIPLFYTPWTLRGNLACPIHLTCRSWSQWYLVDVSSKMGDFNFFYLSSPRGAYANNFPIDIWLTCLGTIQYHIEWTVWLSLWHSYCTAASQLQGPGFDSRLGSLSAWSLHVLPVSAWVSSGCSGYLPQSKDVRDRLIVHAKFPIVSQDV